MPVRVLRRGRILMWISPFSLLLLFSCVRAYEVPSSELPPYLRPLPGARDVHSRRVGSESGVEYHLTACYPAAVQLQEIASRVPSTWRTRTEDFLNPGIPTSQVRGWTDYHDATKHPEQKVHHWAGEWQEPAGGILTYDLLYRSPAKPESSLNEPTTCEVFVTATFMSRETVRELQQATASPRQPDQRVQPPTTPPAKPIALVRANYLVLRPLAARPTASYNGSAQIYGNAVFYSEHDILLDLRDFDLNSAELQHMNSLNRNVPFISLRTSADGGQRLGEWTEKHVNERLGIFLDGKLISAPVIRSRIDDMIILDSEFTEAQAKEILERLRKGGAL